MFCGMSALLAVVAVQLISGAILAQTAMADIAQWPIVLENVTREDVVPRAFADFADLLPLCIVWLGRLARPRRERL